MWFQTPLPFAMPGRSGVALSWNELPRRIADGLRHVRIFFRPLQAFKRNPTGDPPMARPITVRFEARLI
jgi:hypothetical protein